MKQFTKKFSSFLIAFLLVAMLSTLCVGSAFAMVDISDDYYITDQADVISSSTEEYIISQNAYLEDYCSGAQIVVVVVDFLDGMDIEDYAYRLFDDLDIGSSTEDNGILLLLTIGEENYWCMQGRGLESDLPASTIDDILYYDLEPDFAERAYDAGVKKVFDSLFNEVCEIYDVDAANNGGGSYASGGSFDEDEFFSQASTSAIIVSWAIRIVAILIIMLAVLFIYTVIKSIFLGNSAARGTYMRPAPRPIFRPHRHRPPRPPHPGPGGPGGPHHGGPHPGGPGGPGGPRPSAPRPKPSRPSSGGLFGGGGGSSRGGGAGRRTSSSSSHRSSPSRSSFGGGSRGGGSRGGGMGRGGGGSSRGGGAGRRGR